jgi:tRNA dimethylallyltransferase
MASGLQKRPTNLFMNDVFFIVGPTATGKSELAADVAREMRAEVVSADAFQIYRGLDLLTAKPDAATLAKAPHHLIGTTPLHQEMNAEKFRRAASHAIDEIHSRGKPTIIVGGSGLYIKALTHGLARLPQVNPKLRATLNALSTVALRSQLDDLDPESARKIDPKNRRRLMRALEICLKTGKRASEQRTQWAVAGVGDRGRPGSAIPAPGVFVFRDRDELYERINRRVEAMFENGVIEEVRAAEPMSLGASQVIGLREICQLLEGKMSILQCVAAIQQATRRYAKRQLTWFRLQTNFQPLNLSLLSHNEARILLRKRSEPRKLSAQDD